MRSVLVHSVEPDLKRKTAKEEAKSTIDYIWNAFCVALEKKDDAVRRKMVARDVYGSNKGLGTIRPTHWPPASLEAPYHYKTFDANFVILKEADDSSEEGSGGEDEKGQELGQELGSYKQTELLDSFGRWKGKSNFRLEQPWEHQYKMDPFCVNIAQDKDALLMAIKEQEKEKLEYQARKKTEEN